MLKTGFFRQVRELKIQRKNPGSALREKSLLCAHRRRSLCGFRLSRTKFYLFISEFDIAITKFLLVNIYTKFTTFAYTIMAYIVYTKPHYLPRK